MSPAVSIIIPNKDRCDELVQTLASVRAQAFADYECLIVDDNSTDDFDAAVRPYAADVRFRVIRQPADRSGAPAARNDGAAAARGRYVIFLDSDDLIAPHCLQNRVRVMDARPDLDFAVFPCEMFRKTPGDVGMLWNADTGADDLDRFIRHDVPWQTTGPIWRRSSLSKVGPWDEAARSAQDWEFHLRAVLAGLKYERFGPVDLYWRMAGPDRTSIGKSSVLDRAYHVARLALYRRIYRTVCDAGRITDERRRWFVGMYFAACEQIGMKVGRREARQSWSAAHEDGLIGRRAWWQGWLLLAQLKWPQRYERAKASLARRWPAEHFMPRGNTFMKTPVDRAAVGTSPAPTRPPSTGPARVAEVA